MCSCRRFTSHILSTGVVLWILGFVSAGQSAVFTNQSSDTESTSKSATLESTEHPPRAQKNITSFSLATIESLAEIENHIQTENFTEAEEKLAQMLTEEADLTLSEKAEVTYMCSRVSHFQQNSEATISHLESVLQYRDNITFAREAETLLRLAELYLSKKEHTKAHQYIDEWLEIVEQPKASELAFAGNLFVKIKSYSRAKEYLSRAIEKQEDNGLEVDVRWSELLDYVEKQLDTVN